MLRIVVARPAYENIKTTLTHRYVSNRANQGAIEFYLKLGFRIIGTARRQAKIGRTYIDEVAIEKLF